MGIRGQGLIRCGLLLALAAALLGGGARAARAQSCESKWYVSYGGRTSYVQVRTERAGLKLGELSFDWGYSDPFVGSLGYIDFDGDGKTDVFSTKLRADGRYQWRYSSGAAGGWTNLRAESIPPSQLRFGDFAGDGVTDVFVVLAPNELGIRQWAYSNDGTAPLTPLAAIDTRGASALRFGDFNADATTDVFSTYVRGDGFLQWQYSPSGKDPYVALAYDGTPLGRLRFGDVDGNGTTDVFTTLPSGDPESPWIWVYSADGSGSYASLRQTTVGVDRIRLGRFNDDYRSDMFLVEPRGDGLYQWYYAYHTSSAVGGETLAYDVRTIKQLRLGDFDGDNVTDVFALKRVCV